MKWMVTQGVVIPKVLSESCMIVLLFGRVDIFRGSIRQASLWHADIFITANCACGQVDHAGKDGTIQVRSMTYYGRC